MVSAEIYFLSGEQRIIYYQVDRRKTMDCSKCIYGYYYDTCNAEWKSKEQYNSMLQSQKCPYYNEGHKIYLERIIGDKS